MWGNKRVGGAGKSSPLHESSCGLSVRDPCGIFPPFTERLHDSYLIIDRLTTQLYSRLPIRLTPARRSAAPLSCPSSPRLPPPPSPLPRTFTPLPRPPPTHNCSVTLLQPDSLVFESEPIKIHDKHFPVGFKIVANGHRKSPTTRPVIWDREDRVVESPPRNGTVYARFSPTETNASSGWVARGGAGALQLRIGQPSGSTDPLVELTHPDLAGLQDQVTVLIYEATAHDPRVSSPKAFKKLSPIQLGSLDQDTGPGGLDGAFRDRATFLMNAHTLEELAFRVDVVRRDRDPGEAPMARGYCSWETLQSLEGSISMALVGPNLEKVGVFRCSFLVVTEFAHPSNCLEALLRRAWAPGAESINIGHRGTGESQTANAKLVRENTLLSFVTAAASRAMEFIEFDVHLTKDGEVVIYHDFEVKLLVGSQLVKLGIPSLTLQQLQSKDFQENIATHLEISQPKAATQQRRHRRNFEKDREDRKRTLKRSASTDELTFREKGLDLMMEEIKEERMASNRSPPPPSREGSGLSAMNGEDALHHGGATTMGSNGHGPGEASPHHHHRQIHHHNHTHHNHTHHHHHHHHHGHGHGHGHLSRGNTPTARGATPPSPVKGSGGGHQPSRGSTPTSSTPLDAAGLGGADVPVGEVSGQTPWTIQDRATTLREMFQQLPKWLGFNVEIKYPTNEIRDAMTTRLYPRNTLVDTVLKVVFDEAKGRKVIFSTFDADCATLLSLKQPRFPVFFLTCSGTELYPDPRMNSLQAAIAFSHASNLQGIVAESRPLRGICQQVVDEVHRHGIHIYTWGRDNNDLEFVEDQRRSGVDAVISDNLVEFARKKLEKDKGGGHKRDRKEGVAESLAPPPGNGGTQSSSGVSAGVGAGHAVAVAEVVVVGRERERDQRVAPSGGHDGVDVTLDDTTRASHPGAYRVPIPSPPLAASLLSAGTTATTTTTTTMTTTTSATSATVPTAAATAAAAPAAAAATATGGTMARPTAAAVPPLAPPAPNVNGAPPQPPIKATATPGVTMAPAGQPFSTAGINSPPSLNSLSDLLLNRPALQEVTPVRRLSSIHVRKDEVELQEDPDEYSSPSLSSDPSGMSLRAANSPVPSLDGIDGNMRLAQALGMAGAEEDTAEAEESPVEGLRDMNVGGADRSVAKGSGATRERNEMEESDELVAEMARLSMPFQTESTHVVE